MQTDVYAAEFQSTPSVGRATTACVRDIVRAYISIHALRGEGDFYVWYLASSTENISIHALRGEGDPPAFIALSGEIDISIHALRGEGDDYRALRL